jgi:hypothetical protein
MGPQKANLIKQKEDIYGRVINAKSSGWGKDNSDKFSTRLKHFATNIKEDKDGSADVLTASGRDRINSVYPNICSVSSNLFIFNRLFRETLEEALLGSTKIPDVMP